MTPALLKAPNNTIVTFTHGLQHDTNSDAIYSYLFSNNHFLCSLHKKSDPVRSHCLSMNHTKLFESKVNVLPVSTRYPVWMENVHSSNDKNTIKSKICLPGDILARFGLPPRPEPPAAAGGGGHAAWRARFEATIVASGAMKPTSFASVYAAVFDRVQPRRLLEIGIHEGASIRMWRDILGPEGFIAGLDIREKSCDAARGAASAVYLGFRGGRGFLDRIGAECGPFDLVIDDGSHRNAHMIYTLERMMRTVRPGGAYLVEDMFTSYWPNYGGGYEKDGSFVEYTKEKIDGLFAPFCAPKYKKQFGDHPLPEIPAGGISEVVSEICVHAAGLTVFYRK